MKTESCTLWALWLFVIVLAGVACAAAPRCEFVQRPITVDGNLSDWNGIKPNAVQGQEHLWFGQGMTRAQWTDDGDLSYQWRGAWFGDQLYFAIEVADDRVVEPNQVSSFLCDCVEIYLDYNNQGARRVKVLDGREDWFGKCDPRELMGYEMHFLATDPPRVFLDHTEKYALDKPQTDRFKREWAGQAVFRKTGNGYLLEVGFRVPGVPLLAGKTVGVEIGVCDDDGKGRENIMMWTGTKSNFWITMDDYGKATLAGPLRLESRRNPDGSWGVSVQGNGLASVTRQQPVELEFWLGPGRLTNTFASYGSVAEKPDGLTGKALLFGPNQSRLEVEDRWHQEGAVIRLNRQITVSGNATSGFMSGFQFDLVEPLFWTNAEWFAPGMIYGGFDHLTETAIGGQANYHPEHYTVRIREDRLPAPLFLARFKDGAWVAVLDPCPRGDTTAVEALDVTGVARINGRFQFGAIGGQRRDGKLSLGFWFPGSEGEVTYAGNTYPGGQLSQWRRRYHPITNGFVQSWQVAFRFGQDQTFPECYAAAWRWAWDELKPAVMPHDIALTRRSLVDALAANVMQVDDRAGIPNALPCVPGRPDNPEPKTVMGFTGKALESAEFLLAESRLDNTERGARLRTLAEKIITSFLRLKIAPPEGEGFYLKTGKATTARGHLQQHPEVYLRSFGDDIKALLRAYDREKLAGRAHPEWLAWARQFADWLLTQQQAQGGFPRAWLPPTGQVFSDSPNSSFNAIPLLVHLHRITGEKQYLAAALRAGDCCWANGQSLGRFVGGTIDNPDVLDKEAGTLSLEAYLALYEATKDRAWLDRAKTAADYAETWIYIWNVPMPDDADDTALHWKRGVPTVGLQLIASGHSLVDEYMCFDVDEYARLYQHTGDAHYLDVARILLHNTKAMLALPGRAYDLKGPGWQQEHWSLAPRRGFGLHRLWLPWVSTSHLNGIFGLRDFDRSLYDKLCQP